MVFFNNILEYYFCFGNSVEFSSIVDDPFLFNSNVTFVILDPLASPDFSPKLYIVLIYLNLPIIC